MAEPRSDLKEAQQMDELASAVHAASNILKDAQEGTFRGPVYLGENLLAEELADAINGLLGQARHWQSDRALLERQVDLDREITALMGTGRSLNEIADTIVRYGVDVLGDACAVLLYDEDSYELKIAAVYHKDPDKLTAIKELIQKYPSRVDEGLPAQVIANRKPLLIEDARDFHTLYENRPEYRTYQIRSVIITPLAVSGRLIGLLSSLTDVGGREFDEHDLHLSEILANHAAVMIENACLVSEQSEYAREAQTLYSVSQSIMASLDMQERLEIVITSLANAASAERGLLFTLNSDELKVSATTGLTEAERGLAALAKPPLRGSPVESALTDGPAVVSASHIQQWMGSLTTMLDIGDSLIVPVVRSGVPRYAALLYKPQGNVFPGKAIRLGQATAGLSALAIQKGQEIAAQHTIAETLRSTLVPSEVPEIEKLLVGVDYLPADVEYGLAGDFYDFIPLPDGEWAIIIADVCGKGLRAAAQIAMCKYVVRAYALENPSPSDVLMRASRSLSYQLRESFITLAYLRYNPESRRVSYGSAGHPNMMILTGMNQVRKVTGVAGPPLGIMPAVEYRDVEVDVSPGDNLVLFTDGILEARSGSALFGFEGIERFLRRWSTLPPDQMASKLTTTARTFGGGKLKDDIAVIVAQVE